MKILDGLRRLAPEGHRALRLALKDLAQENADIKALAVEPKGLHRLRVGGGRSGGWDPEGS